MNEIVSKIMYSGKYVNCELTQGDTFFFGIIIHNLKETPDNIYFNIKKNIDDKKYVINAELGNGIKFIERGSNGNCLYRIRIAGRNTLKMDIGKYFYEIKYGYIQNEEVHTALAGILTIKSPFQIKNEGIQSNNFFSNNFPLINYKEITRGNTYTQRINFFGLDQRLDKMSFYITKDIDATEFIFETNLEDDIYLVEIDGKNYAYEYQLSSEITSQLPLGEYYYCVKIGINGDVKTIETGIIFITFNV